MSCSYQDQIDDIYQAARQHAIEDHARSGVLSAGTWTKLQEYYFYALAFLEARRSLQVHCQPSLGSTSELSWEERQLCSLVAKMLRDDWHCGDDRYPQILSSILTTVYPNHLASLLLKHAIDLERERVESLLSIPATEASEEISWVSGLPASMKGYIVEKPVVDSNLESAISLGTERRTDIPPIPATANGKISRDSSLPRTKEYTENVSASPGSASLEDSDMTYDDSTSCHIQPSCSSNGAFVPGELPP